MSGTFRIGLDAPKPNGLTVASPQEPDRNQQRVPQTQFQKMSRCIIGIQGICKKWMWGKSTRNMPKNLKGPETRSTKVKSSKVPSKRWSKRVDRPQRHFENPADVTTAERPKNKRAHRATSAHTPTHTHPLQSKRSCAQTLKREFFLASLFASYVIYIYI